MKGIVYSIDRYVSFKDHEGITRTGRIDRYIHPLASVTDKDYLIYVIDSLDETDGHKSYNVPGMNIIGYVKKEDAMNSLSKGEEMSSVVTIYEIGDHVTVRSNSGKFWTGRIISVKRDYTDFENNMYEIKNYLGKIYTIRQKNIIGLKLPDDIEKSFPPLKPYKLTHDKVIFNGPATIVIWKDGSKTISKCSEDDIFDSEKAIAICFMKRALGEREAKKILKKEVAEYELNTETISELGKSFCKGLLSGFMAKITISPETKIDHKKEDTE